MEIRIRLHRYLGILPDAVNCIEAVAVAPILAITHPFIERCPSEPPAKTSYNIYPLLVVNSSRVASKAIAVSIYDGACRRKDNFQ